MLPKSNFPDLNYIGVTSCCEPIYTYNYKVICVKCVYGSKYNYCYEWKFHFAIKPILPIWSIWEILDPVDRYPGFLQITWTVLIKVQIYELVVSFCHIDRFPSLIYGIVTKFCIWNIQKWHEKIKISTISK